MPTARFAKGKKCGAAVIDQILSSPDKGIPKEILEKRADLMISALRKTIEAMGGTLSLVAEFPGREPVVLSGVAEEEPEQKRAGRKHAHAGA